MQRISSGAKQDKKRPSICQPLGPDSAGDRPGPFGTGLDRLIFGMRGDDFNQGDNSMRAMARIAMLGAVMAAGSVGPARAQSRGLELNGFGGLYVPTNNRGIQNAVLEARRRGSLLYGGRLTFWTGKAILKTHLLERFNAVKLRDRVLKGFVIEKMERILPRFDPLFNLVSVDPNFAGHRRSDIFPLLIR